MTNLRLRRSFLAGKISPSPAFCSAILVASASVLMLSAPVRPALGQRAPAEKPAYVAGDQCPLPARQVGKLPSEFRRIGDYFLVVNDQRVAAEIYQSERPGAVLVLSSALPAPALFMADSVAAVDSKSIEKKPDGVVNLRPEGVLAPQGKYEYVDDEVRFTFQGRQGVLRPQPPLLGLRRLEEVTSHNPEYLTGAKSYSASAPALGALRKEQRPVTVRIYYGSWCSHCRKLVPHAVKLEQELKTGKIRFEYFGVLGNFITDPEIKKIGVTSIPTGVVYVNGREVGRIVGDEAWNALESALQGILKQPTTGSR